MMKARLVKEENPYDAEPSFAAADAQYARFKERLDSLEVLEMEHSALEKEIEREGFELMRLLYQDHLLLRAMRESDVRDRAPVVGSDGVERRHRRTDTERGLMTPFGRVSVERAGYSAPGSDSLYPLDAELNLPSDSFSHGVREQVARQAAKNSFEEVVEAIQRTSGARLGKRQAENLAFEAARDFDEFYETRSQYTQEEQAASGSLLVLSVDGKGISMRPDALREATRKRAEKLGKEYGPPSNANRQVRLNSKRMATVAAVYGIKPYVRTAREIARNLRGVSDVDERTRRPSPENKRVWASVVESPAQVIGHAFDEALRRDPGQNKRWVALVDGNAAQLEALKHHANEHGSALTIVLDLIHVIGYLWQAARVLGGDSPPEQHQWVEERLSGVLQGKCVNVAAGMRRSATRRDLPQKQREPVDTCANYLLKYQEYLRYDEYLADGLPIATGVIEGACRHLVQDRMGITGARWGLEGAEAILRLRALHISGDFETYWRFHLQQERHRNHTMLYAKAPPSTRPMPTPRPVLRSVP